MPPSTAPRPPSLHTWPGGCCRVSLELHQSGVQGRHCRGARGSCICVDDDGAWAGAAVQDVNLAAVTTGCTNVVTGGWIGGDLSCISL